MKIVDYINEYFGMEVNNVAEFLKDFEYDLEGDTKDMYVNLVNFLKFIERKQQ